MYCDNTGAIAIAKDHRVTKGARHFRAKVHYLRETIEMGDVRIEKVDIDDNLADPFTKALAFPKHSELTKKIGMIPASSVMVGVVPTIEEPMNMYCDNTGAITIAKYHRVTKGARHFHAKVHYLRETIEMGDALNSSDKPKLKGGPSQLQSSHLVNQQHTSRSVAVKPDVAKTSTMGKLLVLKPSRERNGISSTPKESLSPTGGSKLPVSSLSVPSAVGSPPPLRNTGNSSGVANLEKRASSQALSRSNFFNLMRKKSLTSNSYVAPDTVSSGSPSENPGELVAPPAPKGELGSAVVQQSSETKVELIRNGGEACDVTVKSTSNGNNHSGPDVILYSEEEEARFLRSLGWDETAEEEEGLTEEEISSFYKNSRYSAKMTPIGHATAAPWSLLNTPT
ncbi:hypothetical protein Tco_1013620 [Tanacetum coccineum]